MTTNAKITKRTSKSKTKTKPKTATAYAKIEKVLASTATLATEIARGTERRIREIAASVSASDAHGVAATDLLTDQHRQLERIFDELESANGSASTLLRTLANDLAAHMTIEERLFYPAVRKLDEGLILEGLEEHAMGRFALERLLATTPGHEAFKARVKALKELMVNHHKEEERDLFPKARKAMSKEAQRALGERMKALFDETVQRGYKAALASLDGRSNGSHAGKSGKNGAAASLDRTSARGSARRRNARTNA